MATNNNIDKLFRDKLSNYELESPDNVWNNIMLQKANKPFWKYSYSIVILLVSALSGLSFWFTFTAQKPVGKNITNTQNTMQLVESNATEKNPKIDHIQNINFQNTEQKTKAANNKFSEKKVENKNSKSANVHQAKQTYFTSNNNQKYTSDIKENITTKSTQNYTNTVEENQSKHSNLKNNSIAETPQKTNKINDFEDFNKTINRDKSIPSLVLNLEKPKTEQTDGTDGQNKTENTEVKYKPSPWSFEIGIRSSFANSSYQNSSADWNKQVAARKQSEKFLPSFGVNAKVNYNVNDKIGIVSGISYLNLKQKLDFQHTNTTITVEQKTKNGVTLNPDGSVTPYSYTYMDTTQNTINNSRQNTNQIAMLDIPLMLDMKLYTTKGFSLSIQPGIMANIYMKKNGYEINKNADNTETTKANNYKISAGINYRLGLNAEVILSKKTSLVFQPYYMQNVSGLNGKNYPVNYKINQISADIGIKFQLP